MRHEAFRMLKCERITHNLPGDPVLLWGRSATRRGYSLKVFRQHSCEWHNLYVPVQNGCLSNTQSAAGIGALTARVPQALAGLSSHQHWGDVVDLISRLRTGALLGLRDATAFTPAPAGVEDQDQTQDGQQKGDHPTLRGGGWWAEQRIQRGWQGRGGKKAEKRKRTDMKNKFKMDQSNAASTILKCTGAAEHLQETSIHLY